MSFVKQFKLWSVHNKLAYIKDIGTDEEWNEACGQVLASLSHSHSIVANVVGDAALANEPILLQEIWECKAKKVSKEKAGVKEIEVVEKVEKVIEEGEEKPVVAKPKKKKK